MSEVNLSLDGKVALVTGGSKGLGRSIAFAFAEHGANFAIAARGREALEATRRDIQATGRRCLALSADMAREEDWSRIVDETVSALGAGRYPGLWRRDCRGLCSDHPVHQRRMGSRHARKPQRGRHGF